MKKILILASMLFCSCINNYKNYHANWIVTDVSTNGKNESDEIGKYNLEINVKLGKAYPITLHYWPRDVIDYKIDFSRNNNSDFIEFCKHPVLKGRYLIKCLDEKCCKLEIGNEIHSFKFDYNGDPEFGRSRDCEPAKLPF